MAQDASARRRAWLAATRRRNEVINLSKHRAAHRLYVDQNRFLFVIAQALASAEPGRFRVKNRFVTWHGLDRVSLARAAADAGLGQLGSDDPLIDWVLSKVAHAKVMGADTAGHLLALTAEERDLLSIRTMEAIDEPKARREARRREEKRIRERQRKRQSRGRKPRSEYEAGSLSKAQPWVEMGISRRTYYRRQSGFGTSVSATSYEDGTSVSVAQVCPPTHIINGWTDTLVPTAFGGIRVEQAALQPVVRHDDRR